jgi:hypothetical protein
METPVVQNICRKLVPYIQCYLFYRAEFKATYQQLNSAGIGEKLESLKFYSVKELQNTYTLKHDSSVHVIVSNKTCMDTNEKSTYWKYYIRFDLLDNLKEIVKGFLKLFTRNQSLISAENNSINEKLEKELVQYCILMWQFVDYKLNDEDRREIEKEHNIKLSLPVEEPKWSIKEALVLRPIQQPETAEELAAETLESNKNRQFNNQEKTGPSRRQKLLELEKLSQSQLNEPQPTQSQSSSSSHPYVLNSGTYQLNQHLNPKKNESNSNCVNETTQAARPVPTSVIISNRSHEALDKNLNDLANRQKTDFTYQSEVLRPKPSVAPVSDEYANYGLSEWPDLLVSKLETLRNSLIVGDSALNERNKEYLHKIGRWGEMWVNEALKSKYSAELRDGKIKIEWMNETCESGLPYDFRISKLVNEAASELTFENTSDEEANKALLFIEVKSTVRNEQESFPISYQELLFAQKFAENFEVYRLYNAAGDNPNNVKLKIIKNLAHLLYTHGINLFILL